MKTLLEIKDQVAFEIGYISWDDMDQKSFIPLKKVDKVMKLYAEEALKEVAERTHIMSDGVFRINKQSVLKLINELK